MQQRSTFLRNRHLKFGGKLKTLIIYCNSFFNREGNISLPREAVGLKSKFRGTLGLIEKPVQRKRRYIGDLTGEDFGTPRKRQRNPQLVKEVVYKQRSKINSLQATVRRLRNKITNLNSLIQHLRTNRCLHKYCIQLKMFYFY
ncbi:unnamed protein product [Ceutorhynchus assimilis]|uniref:Uncharacterized protein n=1 Tax=Ceutorhynchus assimilis TaxID=467358 RepID=A0A9N9MG38_9CUCU|nr:unnamed protein product [Ceutorhynchus assimilis]